MTIIELTLIVIAVAQVVGIVNDVIRAIHDRKHDDTMGAISEYMNAEQEMIPQRKRLLQGSEAELAARGIQVTPDLEVAADVVQLENTRDTKAEPSISEGS